MKKPKTRGRFSSINKSYWIKYKLVVHTRKIVQASTNQLLKSIKQTKPVKTKNHHSLTNKPKEMTTSSSTRELHKKFMLKSPIVNISKEEA